MNNARKLTLLENAIRRLTEEGSRDMAAGNYDSADSLSVEVIDLLDWLHDLNISPGVSGRLSRIEPLRNAE